MIKEQVRKGTDRYFSNEKGQSAQPWEMGETPGGLMGLVMKEEVFTSRSVGSKLAEARQDDGVH